MNKTLNLLLALSISTLIITGIPAPTSAAQSICPEPSPGKCVYKNELIGTSAVVDDKYIGLLKAILAQDPETLALSASRDGINDGQECELIAICFTRDYKIIINNPGDEDDVVIEQESFTWVIDKPTTIEINSETEAAGASIILDFRGENGEKTIITTSDGEFESGDPSACGVTFKGSHIYAAGFVVQKMPADGICDEKGAVDLGFEDVVSRGNGGNGFTIQGEDVTLTNVEASYNKGNGIEVLGSNVKIEDSRIISNMLYGLHVGGNSTNTSISNSIVAGNGAGNIYDESGHLEIENVTQDCPDGYTLSPEGFCKKDCTGPEYDFMGECVHECPKGYAPTQFGVCAKATPGLDPSLVSYRRAVGGCSLVSAGASPSEAAPTMVYLIISLCLAFAYRIIHQ